MPDLSAAIAAYRAERDKPYRIPLVVGEESFSCSGKHARLKAALERDGWEVRNRIGRFKWSDVPLPPEVLKAPRQDKATHLFLEVKVHGQWQAVDASWDPGLASILPVTDWDGTRSVLIAVPCYVVMDVEEGEAYLQSLTADDATVDLRSSGGFYNALNVYLERVRAEAGTEKTGP